MTTLHEWTDTLFEDIPTPMWVCEAPTLRILASNQAAQSSYGYSARQLEGMTLFDLAHGEHRTRLEQARLGRGRERVQLERAGGQPRWVELTLKEVSWAGAGQARGARRALVLAMAHEIEEHVQQERAQRATIDALEATLRSMNQRIVVLDGAGRIIQRYEPKPPGVQPWPSWELASGQRYEQALEPALAQALSGALEQMKTRQSTRFEYDRGEPGQQERWAGLVTWREDAHDPGSVTVVTHDISALHQAKRERDGLDEQLRQAQKMEAYGQLASGVAHDFSNLLTIIDMQVSLMRMEERAPELDAGLEEIARAVERGATLTTQLLALGRAQVMERKALSLRDVLMSVISLLRRVLSEDITLESVYSPGLPQVMADEDMLHHALMNLALNARDAMPRGGQLRLSLSLANEQELARRPGPSGASSRVVKLAVEDSGEGVRPEHLPKLCDPFFTTKPKGRGTGLGLTTVQGIMVKHEGWLEVQSERGRGTQISLFFPALEDSAAQTTRAPREAAPGGLERVLLVEDEPSLRHVAARVLRRCGYTVEAAADAHQAKALWSEHEGRFDVLVTDLILPGGLNGAQLAHELGQQAPTLKVLITSGHSAELIREHLVQGQQAPPMLLKPYVAQALARAVRACLDEEAVS